jgi:predicted dehydrogenase
VVSGEIGTPNLFHIVSRDPFPPPLTYLRPSGGIFLDMMMHDFDMAHFLIGDEVEEVFAAGAVRVDPGFPGRMTLIPPSCFSASAAELSAPSTTAGSPPLATIKGSKSSVAKANCLLKPLSQPGDGKRR